MASINDKIENWSNIVRPHTFIKNDIVKYNGYFWYALRDHEKQIDNSDQPRTGSSYWGGMITLQNNLNVPFFIWIASYTSTVQHKPLVTTIRFGNGYEQRISKSFNPDLRVYQMQFDQRTEHEARAIIHFFSARNGTQSFIFNPPGIYSQTAFSTRFVCREWDSTFTFKENYSVKAKMEEIAG